MMATFKIDLLESQMSASKFIELVKFLDSSYLSLNTDFHGIVFTETRSGVTHLAKVLRQIPRMKSIEFFEFMGHGKSKNAIDVKTKGIIPSTAQFLQQILFLS